MDPSMKVLWLERWNQPPNLRVQLKFPKPDFNDDNFYDWLNKATWWAQLAVEAQKIFDGVVRDQKATINYLPDGRDPISTIFYYIEQIRISFWETTFYREFAIQKGVNKNYPIEKQYLFRPALHRVLYRYFKYVLFLAKAIS